MAESTPLWLAGHLPLKGGDYSVSAARLISPFEGEMAGRPEGGEYGEEHSFLKAVRNAWSGKTSSLWAADNPARGQCGVTALVAQDHLGGEILKTKMGGRWHFYNRVAGRRVDFTSSQFDHPIQYDDLLASRQEAFSDTNDEQYAELSNCLSLVKAKG